jgi:hypothetical protein
MGFPVSCARLRAVARVAQCPLTPANSGRIARLLGNSGVPGADAGTTERTLALSATRW